MNIIGKTIKANLLDEFGEVTGQIEGYVIDKIRGVKKVRNQLPREGSNIGMFWHFVPVDYYLLKTSEGFEKVECMQAIGYPDLSGENPSQFFPYVGS